MLKKLDSRLNAITMYRLVLYALIALAVSAAALSGAGLLPYSFSSLIGSAVLLLLACYMGNRLFAYLFRAQTNIESAFITALILFLVLTPALSVYDYLFLVEAAVVAMASKYILAIGKKHIFNPVAVSIFLLATAGVGSGSWWVSHTVMLPFVTVAGLLIVRKIRRFHLFLTFTAVATVVITAVNMNNGMGAMKAFIQVFAAWPTIFFATIMLTEPLTTPPTTKLQMVYGGIVGVLFGLPYSFGPVYLSQESALVIGNIFSYLISPKNKLFLHFKEKRKLSADTWEFVFSKNKPFSFHPGQYMEWTLSHNTPDSRGNRRYFTIASSPKNNDVHLGVKLAGDKSSSFKKKLDSLKKGDAIVASQLSGDFTLPKAGNRKLVFVAGGIGVTPFHSMIQHLTDTNQKRDGVLFYSAPTDDSFAFKEFFDKSEKRTGVRMVYIVTKKQGYLTENMVKKEVPDYMDRMFYLSGPISMVDSYRALLRNLGVHPRHILTDYFPGF